MDTHRTTLNSGLKNGRNNIANDQVQLVDQVKPAKQHSNVTHNGNDREIHQ